MNGKNDDGFQYGNVLLVNTGYARTLSTAWEGALEINGRTASRDRTEDGEDDPNSGGTVFYLSPGVRWTGLQPLRFDLLVQVPVVQALHGVQSEHATARLGVTWLGR